MKRKNKKVTQEINPVDFQKQSLESFKPLLSVEEYNLLAEEINHPLLPAIRLNPLKTEPGFINYLTNQYHWKAIPIPFCPAGFRIDASEGVQVSQTREHHLGQYYIQETASMLPPEFFDIDSANPGLTLDLAASPGGKTSHLVARTLDNGFILANDSSQGRIPALRIVLQNWGAVNTAISQFPGEKLGGWFPEVFDRALIDAPCSMQGLRTAESHTTRPVTEKESLSLSRRQTALLLSALQAVKVGGQVVYSTCTLLPDEDEGVVNAILQQFGQSVRLVNIQSRLPQPAPGLTRAGDLIYAEDLAGSVRLWPHRLQTAGFYACLLEKIAPIETSIQNPPSRSLDRTGFHPCSLPEEKKISIEFMELFGFDLQSVLEKYHLRLVSRLEKVFAFPEIILDQFIDLPLESAGLTLAEFTPEGLVPSHEWVSRFGNLFSSNTVQIDEDQAAHWLHGEDLFDFNYQEYKKGQVLIVLDSNHLVLGRGKVNKDRLKNLLPRRLI